MRYDKKIYFVKEGEEEYDYSTGDTIVTEPVKTLAWANVSDMGTQRQVLVFGSVKQGALSIRLRSKYEKPFDHIEYNGKKYDVARNREFRHKQAFEVSERL